MSKVFICLLACFALHNLSETLIFLQLSSPINIDLTLRVYYVATIMICILLCLYAIEVSELKHLRTLNRTLSTWGLLIVALLLFTSQIVAGYSNFDYAMMHVKGITAIRGNYYWVFQLTVLFMLLFVTTVLITGYLQARQHAVQIRCIYTLLALSPLILVCTLVLGLMAINFNVNAMVLLPLASTPVLIFLAVKTEFGHKVKDIRTIVPYSLEKNTLNEIQNITSKYAMENQSHKEAIANIEKCLVVYKNAKAGNNVSKTAQSMGLPRSTLYAIFKRLGIPRT